MISKKAKKNILYIILIVSVLCFALYKGKKDGDELQSDSTQTIAKITSLRPAKKGSGVWLIYEFYVGPTKYTNETKCEGLTTDESQSILNKSLPLIYATKNPTNHHLVTHKNQYEFYHIQIADSLKPILQLIDYN